MIDETPRDDPLVDEEADAAAADPLLDAPEVEPDEAPAIYGEADDVEPADQ